MADSADPDQKPTDLDLHCLQRQGISGFSMTRGKSSLGIFYMVSDVQTTLFISTLDTTTKCIIIK